MRRVASSASRRSSPPSRRSSTSRVSRRFSTCSHRSARASPGSHRRPCPRSMPPDAALRVRFWGTRGSIPVAMTSAEVQRKLITTLVRAAGRAFDTPEKAAAFLEREVDFAESHTFGGNSSCVQLVTGSRDYVLCDLGSGARVFSNEVLAAHGSGNHTFHVFMSHVHWDHIMGFPFFL